MLRILLFLAALALLVFLLRRLLAPLGFSDRRSRRGGSLVRCAHCGTYVPQAEALSAGDKTYCSREHLRAGGRPTG